MSFFSTAGEVRASALHRWWEQLFPEEPDESVTKKAENTERLQGKLAGANGIVVLGRVGLRSGAPGRIDLAIQASNPIESVGPMEGLLKRCCETAAKLLSLEGMPAISRVAVAAEAARTFPGIRLCMRNLQELLPRVQIDAENTRDFVYVVNRPRRSTSVPELEVNVLGTWAFENIVGFAAQLAPGQTQVPMSPVEQIMRVKMAVDANTSAESLTPLPASKSSVIIAELSSLVQSTLIKGDA